MIKFARAELGLAFAGNVSAECRKCPDKFKWMQFTPFSIVFRSFAAREMVARIIIASILFSVFDWLILKIVN